MIFKYFTDFCQIWYMGFFGSLICSQISKTQNDGSKMADWVPIWRARFSESPKSNPKFDPHGYRISDHGSEGSIAKFNMANRILRIRFSKKQQIHTKLDPSGFQVR